MFFINPPVIKTSEIFTTMPEHFRRRGTQSVWGAANRGGVSLDCFLEGPVFDDAGNLFVTDIPYGRIFKIDPKGVWTLVVEYDGEPNGMKFMSPGILLVTDYKNGLITVRVDTGEVTSLLQRRNTERFKGLNDLTIDRQGNIYFTDQGQTGLHDPTGRVYRLRLDGQLDLLLGNVPSPNGIVLSPDEKVLFVAVTRGNCVWRGPIMEDGSLAKVGQFFTSYGTTGPDGIAMDQSGNLVIANPGLGYVWLVNPKGQPIGLWQSPAGEAVTNIAFGGPDNKTLYCTDSTTGTILVAQLPEPGMPMYQRIPQ